MENALEKSQIRTLLDFFLNGIRIDVTAMPRDVRRL